MSRLAGHHVAVLLGGLSSERAVSLVSGAACADALERLGATVTRIDGSDRMSLQVLCRGAITWQRLEDLKRAGAEALRVLPVERMLA